MREVTPTRSTAIELADERKLMRQGYEFLDEKRMLLATEMLQPVARAIRGAARAHRRTKSAAQRWPRRSSGTVSISFSSIRYRRRRLARHRATLFLGLAMLSAGEPPEPEAPTPPAIDPSPEAKACRAAFAAALGVADLAARAGNLNALAREYRRTERRATALEKVLLPEVEAAIKMIDEQLDMLEREEAIRTRWSSRIGVAE